MPAISEQRTWCVLAACVSAVVVVFDFPTSSCISKTVPVPSTLTCSSAGLFEVSLPLMVSSINTQNSRYSIDRPYLEYLPLGRRSFCLEIDCCTKHMFCLFDSLATVRRPVTPMFQSRASPTPGALSAQPVNSPQKSSAGQVKTVCCWNRCGSPTALREAHDQSM